MTRVAGLADDRVHPSANACLTDMRGKATVRPSAGGAIRLRRVVAGAGGRVAPARLVAIVGRGTLHGIGAGANPVLAGIGLGAGILIVAAAAVRFQGIGALPSRRVADPGLVAGIGGGADHGVSAGTASGLTGIVPGAGIPVVAG